LQAFLKKAAMQAERRLAWDRCYEQATLSMVGVEHSDEVTLRMLA
jgi:hypothetical protein